ncbi:MAG: DUF1345 domain-containing protein [Phenylobacterium sp.]
MARAPAKFSRPAIVGAFATRPRLLGSMLTGLGVGLGLAYFTPLGSTTGAVIGWDAMCLTFIGLMFLYMSNRDQRAIRTHAERADEGRIIVLVLILTASVVSIVAVVMELSDAKAEQGLPRILSVTLAFVTVALSWFFVQLNFALHYAHAYYTRTKTSRSDAGGLLFPGTAAPDYWDFLHFAIIIGVATATADIDITDKGLRRLGTAHSLFAFAFNTVIVALTINLLAGLL